MYRQKGTGRARKGTAGSPVLVGGGVANGPKPRVFRVRVPKKVKRLAICSAFTQKVRDEALRVLEDFELVTPKTRRMAQMAQHLKVSDQKALLVTAETSEAVIKSCRNLPGVSVVPVNQISTYDVVRAEALIVTQGAMDRIRTLWGAE